MAVSSTPLPPPTADDFQRMGLRRMEFRPPLIRKALARTASPLALLHLRSPNGELERMLASVMASGYAVLDPRRRADTGQRVMLGRIHPQLLEDTVELAPTPVNIAQPVTNDSLEWIASPSDTASVASESVFAASTVATTGFSVPRQVERWTVSINTADLQSRRPGRQAYRELRRRLHQVSWPTQAALTLLAASVLLIVSWQTTVLVRSWNASSQLARVEPPHAAAPTPAGPTPAAPTPAVRPAQPASVTPPESRPKAASQPNIDLARSDSEARREVVAVEASPEPKPSEFPPVAPSFGQVVGGESDVAQPKQPEDIAEAPLRQMVAALPPEETLASARLKVEMTARTLKLASGNGPVVWGADNAGAAGTFHAIANQAALGSPERFVAYLLAGQTAGLEGMREISDQVFDELTSEFDLSRGEAVLWMARGMVDEPLTAVQQSALDTWMELQLGSAMASGDLEFAEKLNAVLQQAGVKGKVELFRESSKRWRGVITLAKRYAEAAERIDTSASPDAGDRDLAARYWALIRRDWPKALPLFAAGGQSRLERLAAAELLLGESDAGDAVADEPTGKAIFDLIEGYLAESQRLRGWMADSLVIHAHRLAERFGHASDGPLADRLLERAGQISNDHPGAFPSAVDTVVSPAQPTAWPSGGTQPGEPI